MLVSHKPRPKTAKNAAAKPRPKTVKPPSSGWYEYRHICAALGIALRTAKKYVRRGRVPSPEYRDGRAYWSTLAMDELQRLGVQPDGTYKVNESRQARVAKAAFRPSRHRVAMKRRKKGGAR